MRPTMTYFVLRKLGPKQYVKMTGLFNKLRRY